MHYPDPQRRHAASRSATSRRWTASASTIDGGETFALVGESGCGKSTTGYAMLGMIEPTAGHVGFDGTDLTQLDRRGAARAQRDMQIVFQDPYRLAQSEDDASATASASR